MQEYILRQSQNGHEHFAFDGCGLYVGSSLFLISDEKIKNSTVIRPGLRRTTSHQTVLPSLMLLAFVGGHAG